MKFSGTVTLQYDTAFSPFSAADWREGLDWLAASGFDAAEVCIADYRGMDVRAVKAELDARGLSCSTISTGQAGGLENISLLHEGEALRKAQERILQHIDAAAVLGSRVTLGLLRGSGTAGRQEEEKKMLAGNMEPVIRYAEEKQVTLVLEPINRYETALLNSAAEVMDFIERNLRAPRCVKVLWDTFHANIEDPDFESALDKIGDRLGHVHIADSNRWFPGYGHIDFEPIIKSLADRGYDGFCSFECLNLPDVRIVRERSGPWIARMRGLAAR